MTADIESYISKITWEHTDKPKFEAMLRAVIQPMADITLLLQELYSYFDLDTAIGAQLDIVGQWIGRTRDVLLPNVYFSLDVIHLGLDEGYLMGPYDPVSHLASLDDDHYRLLLRAVILNNQWDGSIPMAYDIWDTLFPDEEDIVFIIQDTGQMTMYMALVDLRPAPSSFWDNGASIWDNYDSEWDVGVPAPPPPSSFWDAHASVWDNASADWDIGLGAAV